MYHRVATFVDAGYFFAASSQAIKSKSIPRKNIQIISPELLLQEISAEAIRISKCGDTLRTYWYDAMQTSRMSLEQTRIATLAGVKLRLGSLNNAGEQKGVDSLIVTDLIELARNKAIADAILVSGDEDLRIAVQLAQTFGVRVHVLAIGDHNNNVSPALKMEADSFNSLDANWLAKHFQYTDHLKTTAATTATSPQIGKDTQKAKTTKSATASPTEMTIEQAAEAVSKELTRTLKAETIAALKEHFKTSKSVPPEYDGKLVAKTAAILTRELSNDEKRSARGVFVNTIRSVK